LTKIYHILVGKNILLVCAEDLGGNGREKRLPVYYIIIYFYHLKHYIFIIDAQKGPEL